MSEIDIYNKMNRMPFATLLSDNFVITLSLEDYYKVKSNCSRLYEGYEYDIINLYGISNKIQISYDSETNEEENVLTPKPIDSNSHTLKNEESGKVTPKKKKIVEKEQNGTHYLLNNQLSSKAKTVASIAMLQTKKVEKWSECKSYIIEHCKESQAQIEKAITELRKHGYLELEPVKVNNKISFWSWKINHEK